MSGLLLALSLALPAGADVQILDNWSTGLTHSVSAGSNRLLIFVMGAEHTTSPIGSISGVTWGGQALTKIEHAVETGATAYENRLEMWYLDEAGIAAASGNTFVITGWTGTDPADELYDAVTLENVDQATPIGDFSPGNIADAPAVQIGTALNVAAGDMVVYGAGSSETGENHTASAGYTEEHEQDSGGSGQVLSQATKAIAAPGTEQPTASWSGGNNRRLVMVAAVIKAASIAVTSAVAEISPNSVDESSTGNAFTYDILPTIGVNDTGVNQVVITAPAGYAISAVTGVTVGVAGQGPVNCPTPTPATTEYCASIAGQDITVTLGTKVTVDATKIQVVFDADAPGSAGSADFTSTVDDTATPVVAAQATAAGNADGDGADANSWMVSVKGWFDPAWPYRKPVNLDGTDFCQTVSGFPVAVILSTDTDLQNYARNDGFDILFTQIDGVTKLPHEIEAFTKASGDLVAWVKLDIESGADQTIYMYYGYASAPNQQDLPGLWDADYEGVWHMHNSFNDSTSNSNNGTNNGTTNTGGRIANARSYGGTDYIDAGDPASLRITGTAITVSAWINASSWATPVHMGTIVDKHNWENPPNECLGYALRAARNGGTNGEVSFVVADGDINPIGWKEAASATDSMTTGNWYHVAGRYDGTNIEVFINGVSQATTPFTGNLTASNIDLNFGRHAAFADRFFNGSIDEVRISGQVLPDEWIQAEVCTAGGVVGGTGPPEYTPAVTSVVAEIAPNVVAEGSTGNVFIYDILPTISGSDTGVDQVVITAPAGYGSFSVTAVSVGGAGQGPLNCPTPGGGQYCAAVAGQDITVTLGTRVTLDATNIQVQFTADAPGGAGSADFTATVDDTATGYPAQAAAAGNADGDGADNNSWAVTVSSGTTISGQVFTDEGTINAGAGLTVHLLVNGASIAMMDTDGTGAYSTNVLINAGDTVLVYVDDEAALDGTTVTVSDGANLAGLDIYADHLITRHDNSGSLTNTLLNTAKGAWSDSEILYTVTGGNLTVSAGTELYIPSGHSFTPGLNVTAASLENVGTFNGGTGTLTVNGDLVTSGSFTATSSTLSVAGDLTISGTFAHNNGGVTLTGTTDQSVTTGGQSFNHLTLDNTGAGGSDDIIVSGALDIDGTLTLTDGDLDISTNDPAVNTAGDVSIGANGSIDVSGRSVAWTFDGTSIITDSSGSGPQDLADVVLNGTSLTLAASTLVETMTVTSGTLDLGAGGYVLEIDGTGSPLSVSGTFAAGTSTVRYTGTGAATDIAAVAYDNLQLTPTAATTFRLVADLTGANALSGNLTIDANATLDAVGGSDFNLTAVDVTINGAYSAQGSTITAGGNWSDSGTFTPGTSTVVLNGTGIQSVTTGTSSFNDLTITNNADVVTFNDAFSVNNFTAKTAGSRLTFSGGATYTVNGTWTLTVKQPALKSYWIPPTAPVIHSMSPPAVNRSGTWMSRIPMPPATTSWPITRSTAATMTMANPVRIGYSCRSICR